MSDRSAFIFQPSFASTKGFTASTTARTRLLSEGPIFPTLLRLAAPNILNLIAFAGLPTLAAPTPPSRNKFPACVA